VSKLAELVRKGVNLIVADEGRIPGEVPSDSPPPPARGQERSLSAEQMDVSPPREVSVSSVPADVADFGAVYSEAGIELPLHGYGVDKVAEMLASPRLASLNREVRAAAVLAALEAAMVPAADPIQDAVRRDKALDAFEAAKRRELDELHGSAESRIAAIKEEIETFLREKNAEMEGLKQARETAERAFADLAARKRREEERLHDVVAHFLEGAENPVTTAANASSTKAASSTKTGSSAKSAEGPAATAPETR
jgi:hypothetical protein